MLWLLFVCFSDWFFGEGRVGWVVELAADVAAMMGVWKSELVLNGEVVVVELLLLILRRVWLWEVK